jgi:hypothetical protein
MLCIPYSGCLGLLYCDPVYFPGDYKSRVLGLVHFPEFHPPQDPIFLILFMQECLDLLKVSSQSDQHSEDFNVGEMEAFHINGEEKLIFSSKSVMLLRGHNA